MTFLTIHDILYFKKPTMKKNLQQNLYPYYIQQYFTAYVFFFLFDKTLLFISIKKDHISDQKKQQQYYEMYADILLIRKKQKQKTNNKIKEKKGKNHNWATHNIFLFLFLNEKRHIKEIQSMSIVSFGILCNISEIYLDQQKMWKHRYFCSKTSLFFVSNFTV